MTNTQSCLVSKLSYYTDLSTSDEEKLASLEKSERDYGPRENVSYEGDTNGDLFVVKSGWLFSSVDMADGRRQIVKIHHPGDILGFPDIALNYNAATICTVEETWLCPFPKSALDVVLRDAPRLSALLLSIALREQVVFIDLLKSLGRLSARERLSYMLLDILSKLKVTNPSMTDTIRLPLNQTQIADYLGLTNVYVSRTLLQLEDLGIVTRVGDRIKLNDVDALAETIEFQDRYSDMDTSWFPSSA